ncbi:uncharacterized protein LOC114524617 [Dendronephthya gigantea]|uniref:uncharacterized protein LOC114524617 n=1 Tax=Dendronephthya gigantea TaxID=151771 RepID=UPI001068D3BC|nr:uncharacterized protein LOC114524617 [Dendronephthya gigantea]
MDYETFGSKPNRAERMQSESSNTSSNSREDREVVNVFHPTVRTWDSPFGKLRVPADLENIEIGFLVLATLSIVGAIAMTIYRLANTIDDSDSTLGLLVLINAVFCLIYVYHGVFGERPYQLWAFMIAIVAVTVYCIIQYAIKSDRTNVLLGRLIVLSAFAPFDLILSFYISLQHYTSKNLIIRTVRSANIKLQNMCMNMFIFQTLLVVEFQSAISLIVLILTSGLENASPGEISILVVGIFVGIIWLVVGYLLPKFEDKLWLYTFIILSLPQPAYVLYKIIKTEMNWDQQSKTINASIIACACLFLAARILVCIFLWIVFSNFGKGLREAVYFPDGQKDVNEPHETEQRPSSAKSEEPDDDYLGENVNDDIHE